MTASVPSYFEAGSPSTSSLPTGPLIFLAPFAIGVLGVLVVTTEYSTGSVRSTFVAVPQRREVLAAKAAVFAGATFCSASALGR